MSPFYFLLSCARLQKVCSKTGKGKEMTEKGLQQEEEVVYKDFCFYCREERSEEDRIANLRISGQNACGGCVNALKDACSCSEDDD